MSSAVLEPAAVAALIEAPIFSDIDRHFARLMERLAGGQNPLLALAAALVSRGRGEGHICLRLESVAGTGFPENVPASSPRIVLPELNEWLTALRGTPVVGGPGEFKPIILDAPARLYLHRYWEYETQLAAAIRQRAGDEIAVADALRAEESLCRLFPSMPNPAEPDWQRTAALTALERRLCVISGGPGTGKTRTVGTLLALLLEQATPRPLRIALAAPTGKAAARLQESIQQFRAILPCAELIKAQLPQNTFTLHRLLGGTPDSASFKYNAGNPLPFDVVVVDEASMVDLALMSKLFAAVPPAARIILLGDKDQLASVEAGAVLGDICYRGRVESPLARCIVELQKNHRFARDNGMLELSRAINAGNTARVLELLRAAGRESSGVTGHVLPVPRQLKDALRTRIVSGFAEAVRTRDPLGALHAFGRFRILSALRLGPYGVGNLNRLAEEVLTGDGLINPRDRWYAGRPVMITRNDYQLKLFNGDIGIILPDSATGEPLAWFTGADGQARSVTPLHLPEHETVYAMTVHKSQGSEFGNVLLVLPDRESPVLTRELLYTGVTRASERVEVWYAEAVLRSCVSRRVERNSGLREALWGEPSVRQ